MCRNLFGSLDFVSIESATFYAVPIYLPFPFQRQPSWLIVTAVQFRASFQVWLKSRWKDSQMYCKACARFKRLGLSDFHSRYLFSIRIAFKDLDYPVPPVVRSS